MWTRLSCSVEGIASGCNHLKHWRAQLAEKALFDGMQIVQWFVYG